jgi:hypothetical protein
MAMHHEIKRLRAALVLEENIREEMKAELAAFTDDFPSDHCLNVLIAECCISHRTSLKWHKEREKEWEQAKRWMYRIATMKRGEA